MKKIKFPRPLAQDTTSSHRNILTHRLPTAASRVRSQVRWTKWRWDRFFSEYFDFPCQFAFHRLLHTHHLSSVAGTIRQTVVDMPSGLSPTPPQETKKIDTPVLSVSYDAYRTDEWTKPGEPSIRIHAALTNCCSPWTSAPTE
jgi:hypothetical protein